MNSSIESQHFQDIDASVVPSLKVEEKLARKTTSSSVEKVRLSPFEGKKIGAIEEIEDSSIQKTIYQSLKDSFGALSAWLSFFPRTGREDSEGIKEVIREKSDSLKDLYDFHSSWLGWKLRFFGTTDQGIIKQYEDLLHPFNEVVGEKRAEPYCLKKSRFFSSRYYLPQRLKNREMLTPENLKIFDHVKELIGEEVKISDNLDEPLKNFFYVAEVEDFKQRVELLQEVGSLLGYRWEQNHQSLTLYHQIKIRLIQLREEKRPFSFVEFYQLLKLAKTDVEEITKDQKKRSIFNTIQSLACDLAALPQELSDIRDQDIELIKSNFQKKIKNYDNDKIITFLGLEEELMRVCLESFSLQGNSELSPIPDDCQGKVSLSALETKYHLLLLEAWDRQLYYPKGSLKKETLPPMVPERVALETILSLPFPGLYNHTGDCFAATSLFYLKRIMAAIPKESLVNLEKYPHFQQFLAKKSYEPKFVRMLFYEIGSLLGEDSMYHDLAAAKGNIGVQYTATFLAMYGLCGGYERLAAQVLAYKLGVPPLEYLDISYEGRYTKSHTLQMIPLESGATSEMNDSEKRQTLQEKVDVFFDDKALEKVPPLITLQFFPLSRRKGFDKNFGIYAAAPSFIGELGEITLKDQFDKKHHYRICYAGVSIRYGEQAGHAFGVSYENGVWYEYNNEYKWEIPQKKEKALHAYLAKYASFIAYEKVEDSLPQQETAPKNYCSLFLRSDVSFFSPDFTSVPWSFTHNYRFHDSLSSAK